MSDTEKLEALKWACQVALSELRQEASRTGDPLLHHEAIALLAETLKAAGE